LVSHLLDISVSQLSQLAPLHYRSDFHPELADLINASVTLLEASAPLKLPTSHCHALLAQLVLSFQKTGVSSSAPSLPRERLQSLPATLRIRNDKTMRSYSKAPGVFPSSRR